MIPLRGQQRSLWRVDEESEGGFSIDDAEMDQDDLDTESLTSARALAQKRSASMVSPSGIGSRRRSTIGPARSGEGVAAGSQRQSIRRGDSIGDGSSDLTSADGFDGWSIVTAEEEIEEYWFYCKRWLAKDEDDKMIVRELLPTTKDGKPLSRLSEIVYEVRVKTGDKLGAGTDANVFITLYGAEADSGERELSKSESHRNKFENNNEDVFRLKAIDLGELRKLKIRHDDKGGGADWYLDHVIVADPKSKKEYYFPCNKWLSTSRDGGQISRDLIAVDKSHMGKNVNENLKLEKKAFSDTYHVKVFTGDVRGAGTDANCHIVLFGDSGDSGVIPLQQSKTHVNKFERNNCDEFEIELVDIGELHKIQIGHDNANPWPDWYLEKVEIDCPRLGMSWVFPCGEWIGKSKGDGQLDKTLYPQQGVTKIYANRVPYEITTYTSDKSGAGTSANVFIQIYSAETQTEQALLCSKNERSGKFKRGSVDKFVLELEDVEDPIEKIRIGHDDEGIGSGWHLEKVEIRRFTAGNSSITYVFPCNRWLARDEEDREIVRELVPQKVIEEDDRMGGKGKAREKDFKSSLKMKNYKVHVFTGDKMGAGTNADVFLTVYGTKGDSGERELIKSEKNLDKFERGQEDIFAWEVVDLGQLYKIKIRHNDKGLFSNWFLDRVEVVDASSGEKSVFFAERWLSKSKDDKKLQVTVYAQGYEGDMNSSVSSLRSSGSALTERDRSPRSSVRRAASLTEAVPEGPVGDYTISFTTGRKREMGTEGPIWVRLYGRLPDKKQQRRRGGSFGASDGDRGGGVKRPSGAGIGGRRRRDNEIVTTGHVYLEQDSDTSQKDSKSKMLLVPGSTVKFTFEALMLSEVTKIEIGNEGVTPGKGWYLEEFRLELPTQGRRYVRRCKCWFARDKEDSKTVREFEFDTEDTESVQSYTPMIPYEVLIETANQAEAGTDCRVGLTVFGLKGQSETVYLDKEEKRFERGRKDLIKVNLEDVEPIYKLRLSHDGKGSRREWIVDRVTMTNLENSEVYTFDCGQHIGKDGKCFADMAARAGGGKALIGPVRYRISVKTSDERFSGTNANVFVRLYGEYGDSGDLRLNQLTKPDKKPFQTGQTDTFELELLDLGGLFRCTVWHDDVGLASGWKLDNIVVEDEKRRRRYEFPCGNWLSLRDSGLIKRDLLCDAPPGEDLTRDLEDPKRKVTYEITVQTGDKKDAGMPHDAFLFLEGDLDVMTGEFIMANSLDGERFARGSSDTFRMKHRNLGRLQTLRIGAVDNGAGDRKGYGDRGARGRRRDSQATDGASGTPKQQWNVFSVSVLDTGTGTQYSFPVNKWVPVEHDVRRKGGVTAEVDEIKETSTKARLAKKRDLKIVRYDVEVHTGEEFGSGTNANVSINLIGENGELGMTPLKQKNRDLFERKQVDRFPIECSDLGELKKIRIEHDNTGFRPDWLLSKVIVRDSSSGRVWNFNCNQWLSTKKGDMQLFKELYPSPA
ncbi:hypothetical protein BOX15_Mlig005461g1 [Macrostomum lignano]|uniref:PLAT domain-containing protein n=1 Tax=Macrostomum lignano TaxID=282301 RepID=A0A267GNV9_9PLAT|nr:hypothetical protein BOX15_Mlig005461g1 [Macrostomum lignano]